MSTNGSDPDVEVKKAKVWWRRKDNSMFLLQLELAKEREVLFEKLSTIFGPEIANDYVSPKTSETRQQLSLEELRRRMY